MVTLRSQTRALAAREKENAKPEKPNTEPTAAVVTAEEIITEPQEATAVPATTADDVKQVAPSCSTSPSEKTNEIPIKMPEDAAQAASFSTTLRDARSFASRATSEKLQQRYPCLHHYTIRLTPKSEKPASLDRGQLWPHGPAPGTTYCREHLALFLKKYYGVKLMTFQYLKESLCRKHGISLRYLNKCLYPTFRHPDMVDQSPKVQASHLTTHPGTVYKDSSSIPDVLRALIHVQATVKDELTLDISILQAWQLMHRFHNGLNKFVEEADQAVGQFLGGILPPCLDCSERGANCSHRGWPGRSLQCFVCSPKSKWDLYSKFEWPSHRGAIGLRKFQFGAVHLMLAPGDQPLFAVHSQTDRDWCLWDLMFEYDHRTEKLRFSDIGLALAPIPGIARAVQPEAAVAAATSPPENFQKPELKIDVLRKSQNSKITKRPAKKCAGRVVQETVVEETETSKKTTRKVGGRTVRERVVPCNNAALQGRKIRTTTTVHKTASGLRTESTVQDLLVDSQGSGGQ